MTKVNIGFIGLGKMGGLVARRLAGAGYKLFVHDRIHANMLAISRKGANACRSPEELAYALSAPRVIMLCIPAGAAIDELIRQVSPVLTKGDILADLGNSFYHDSVKRAGALRKRGVHFIDVGMSGGVTGARNGACLMIGGVKRQAVKLDGIFKAISKNGSYKYFSRPGAGHLIKGFHNLIEYGYLQSLAEGLESLYRISVKGKMKLDLAEVCDIWSRGSIIESRLVFDAKTALRLNPGLKGISGSVNGQTLSEMRRLIRVASASGVRNYSGAAAVRARLRSRSKPTYSGKLINAIRNVFGGHSEWKK
ncbi:MAG TPA: 6-phosphogluconate dehydrogenase (decarboxylating) [Elusimicrobia bacterium]|nr:6-phosphogluconate dehydrogenase (decarboxylating) [Elusimicrobiota bacterium]